MTDIEFLSKFDEVISYLLNVIDERSNEEFEVEPYVDQDVMTIDTKSGMFVINKQLPLHEIWLSSPISGPRHFRYNNGKWLSRDNLEFFDLLLKELLIEK